MAFSNAQRPTPNAQRLLANGESNSMVRIDPATIGEMEERVVQINRVAKVQKGGRRFNFSSIVVIGDGRGHVAAGMGKAGEVPESIRKGVEDAKKGIIAVTLEGTTIPHQIEVTYKATRVLLRPARPGTGVIAGGGVRAVMEAAGVQDIVTKTMGSTNSVNVVRAAMLALEGLESVQQVGQRRGKPDSYFGRRENKELADLQASLAPPPAAPERDDRRGGRNDGRGGRNDGRGGRNDGRGGGGGFGGGRGGSGGGGGFGGGGRGSGGPGGGGGPRR